MKTDIHPKYFPQATIRCSCGTVLVAGSTRETLKTELCSKCHPFYTGQQKLVDTAGRVDKFQEKRKKAIDMKAEAKKRAEDRKKKPEAYVEKIVPQEVLERATAPGKIKGKWEAPLGDSPAMEIVKEAKTAAKKTKAKTVVAKKPAIKKAAAKKSTKKK